MNSLKICRLAFAMLAAFSLASCSSDDDNEDKVEQVTVYVSAETRFTMTCGSTRKERIQLWGCKYKRRVKIVGGLSASIPSRALPTRMEMNTNCW